MSYEEDYYDTFIDKEKDAIIVERCPTYWNNKVIDKTIEVTLNYRASHFKTRKAMYKKIQEDLEKVQKSLVEAQKQIESEEK